MTFDEWLDEPQTVTTRRERLTCMMEMDDSFHRREMIMGWLISAWNSGAVHRQIVPRNSAGMRTDGVPLYGQSRAVAVALIKAAVKAEGTGE